MPDEREDDQGRAGKRTQRAGPDDPFSQLPRTRPTEDELRAVPLPDDRSTAVEFAVRWDLLRNLWEVVDYPAGDGPARAAIGHPVGRLLKAWFDRWPKGDTERLMINGDGRYLHVTGRAAPADLDHPVFKELLAGFLRGTLATDRAKHGPVGGTVTFAPAGGWARANFQKDERPPPPLPKKAGRRAVVRDDTLPADAADALTSLTGRLQAAPASDALAEARELLASLAGTTSADPARNKALAKLVNRLADAAGLPLLFDGRPVRVQVVTPSGPVGGYFQARLVGGDRATVYSGEAIPSLTLGGGHDPGAPQPSPRPHRSRKQ
jgi:hypothetical protein